MRLKTAEQYLNGGLHWLSQFELEIKDGKIKNDEHKELQKILIKIETHIEKIKLEFPQFVPDYLFHSKILEIKYQINKFEIDPFLNDSEVNTIIKTLKSNTRDLRAEFGVKINVINQLKQKHQFEDTSYVFALGLPKVQYFEELFDLTKDLNFVLKTIVGKEEKAKIVGFDVGSEWYLIGFDTYIAFKAFGLFINESYKYLKRKKEDTERIEELEVSEPQRAQLEEAMLVANKIFIQDGLNKIARLKNEQEELSPEEMTRNLKALEMFADLLDRNLKINIDKQSSNDENKPPISIPTSESIRNLLENSSSLFIGNETE
ncbi:MAG: hypothetical protein ABS942_16225 [Solibacillus sp.]|uniref:hypothetical protein n=1 Tax=Solibacillus sp. TaxID=1909654 RepID=UPI003315D2E0